VLVPDRPDRDCCLPCKSDDFGKVVGAVDKGMDAVA